ncbi:uncharacterized protein LOC126842406 [Adelges cooleyi]|uniref:uncharacterized protein LOC126842406 n=1 Tax=Adelges cooleyi TaxID=133065 RepID=UPI00218001A2|nr:uncharacterized protein LOC126842406 [Adelges cooleyi]
MKLLCILITLTFVNVSPIMTAGYANAVFVTNKHIKKAFDENLEGLKTAILNTIIGPKSMETISLMWAAPEQANFRFRIDHDDQFIVDLLENIAIADQEAVQLAIFQATNIPAPQRGPNENYTISALDMLSVTRFGKIDYLTSHLLRDEISRGTPEFRNLYTICRLTGLKRSLRAPYAYIKTAVIDPPGNVCTLTSDDGIFQYKPENGFIVEV